MAVVDGQVPISSSSKEMDTLAKGSGSTLQSSKAPSSNNVISAINASADEYTLPFGLIYICAVSWSAWSWSYSNCNNTLSLYDMPEKSCHTRLLHLLSSTLSPVIGVLFIGIACKL